MCNVYCEKERKSKMARTVSGSSTMTVWAKPINLDMIDLKKESYLDKDKLK